VFIKSFRPVYSHYFAIIKYFSAAFILLVLLLAQYLNLWGSMDLILSIIVLYLLIILPIAIYIKIINDAISYEATERAIIKHEGVLQRQHIHVSYAKITNVSVRRSVLNRIFNLGDLYLDTASGRQTYEIMMKNLRASDLTELTNIIKEMIERKENLQPPASQMPGRPPADEDREDISQNEPQNIPESRPVKSFHVPDTADEEKQRLADLEYRAYVRQVKDTAYPEEKPKEKPEKKAKPAKKGHHRKHEPRKHGHRKKGGKP